MEERVIKAARYVIGCHDLAASYQTVNMTETARAMGALGVWESLTGRESDDAIDYARDIAARTEAVIVNGPEGLAHLP